MATIGSPIRVGIIGASADPWAWASTAHVPALKALDEFELVAVASRNQDNADAAAAAHGIARAFGSYDEMIGQPDIDLICVSTSSAHHHALVMPAIAAGKHVFCEWPFGASIDEAQQMRDAARDRGVRTLVGLQTRYAPMVTYARDLIAEGYVGELWSINLHRANDQTVRKAVTPDYLEFLERANAGLRIMGGHALDTLAAYVGELVDIQAYMEIGLKQLPLTTGETGAVTHKDQIVLQGRLPGAAVMSAMLKMNSPTYKPFHLEISGSGGALVITTGDDLLPAARHPGVPYDLTLFGAPALGEPFEKLAVPAAYDRVPVSVPRGQPVDVAHMYLDFARAVRDGTPCETDFDHGLGRHQLLAAIERAAETGERQKLI